MFKNYTLLFVFLSFAAFGQYNLKWGKPLPEELALTICPFDSTASAVILGESGKVNFTEGQVNSINLFGQYTTSPGSGNFSGQHANIMVHRRIKILDPAGIRYAKVNIPYYTKGGGDEIQGLKAHTIVSENGKLIKTEISEADIKDHVISSSWSEKEFVFPNAKEGAILEYKYILATPRIGLLESWIFQHEIPAIFSQVEVAIPSNLKYNILMFGDQLKEKYENVDMNQKLWVMNNIRGIEKEKYVYNQDDYADKLLFQLRSYVTKVSTNMVDEVVVKDVVYSLDQLAEPVMAQQAPFLKSDGRAGKILEQLITPADTRDDKISKIHKYVRDHAKWNTVYNIQPEADISSMLQKGQGNSAEVNLFMCLLLSEAGVPAYPVLVSTKYHGRVSRNFPTPDQFNHILIAIEDNGNYKFLDAAGTSQNPYLIPSHHINQAGVSLKRKNIKWIDILYPYVSEELTSTLLVLGEYKLQVMVNRKFTGYKAEECKSKKPEMNILKLVPGTSLTATESTGTFTRDFAYTEDYTGTDKNLSVDRVALNLNIFGEKENPFTQKTRTYPVELEYPFSVQRVFDIVLKPSDTLLSVPKNLNISLPSGYGKIRYEVSYEQKDKIQIALQYYLATTVIPKEMYKDLQSFYDQLLAKLNEPVMIGKKRMKQ